MIVVASVHHTGTNFVWQNLLNGMTQVGMDHARYVNGSIPEHGFTRIHCDLAQSPYLKFWLERGHGIWPLRHPLLVATSWRARDKSLETLAGQWQILKNKVDPYQPMYLPLDSPDRMNWLHTISRNIGQELQTDWPVVMSCNKNAELSENDRAAVIEVMADGFFDRFGYEV